MATSADLMQLHARFLQALADAASNVDVKAKLKRSAAEPALTVSHFPVHENTATKRFPISKPIQHERNQPSAPVAPTITHIAAAATAPGPKPKKGKGVKVDQADPRTVAAALARGPKTT